MGNIDEEEFSHFVNTDSAVVKIWQKCVDSDSDAFSNEIKKVFKFLIETAEKSQEENYSVK
jgi:hypothetical protein